MRLWVGVSVRVLLSHDVSFGGRFEKAGSDGTPVGTFREFRSGNDEGRISSSIVDVVLVVVAVMVVAAIVDADGR